MPNLCIYGQYWNHRPTNWIHQFNPNSEEHVINSNLHIYVFSNHHISPFIMLTLLYLSILLCSFFERILPHVFLKMTLIFLLWLLVGTTIFWSYLLCVRIIMQIIFLKKHICGGIYLNILEWILKHKVRSRNPKNRC